MGLVKPEFTVGSEKRFADFISGLGNEKIALISHTDLDGIASARIIDEVVKPDMIKFLDYPELDDKLVFKLKEEKIKKVIFSDLTVEESGIIKDIEKFAEVLVIDHHIFKEDFNSDKCVFMNCSGKGFCAAYLCYYLFSKIQDLEKWDWFVGFASIADWCSRSNWSWLAGIVEKFDGKMECEEFHDNLKKTKSFEYVNIISYSLIYFQYDKRKVYDSLKDINGIESLRGYYEEVKKEIDRVVNEFGEKRIELLEGYFYEINPRYEIKSIVATAISTLIEGRLLIIGIEEGDIFKISARRQDGKMNLNDVLKSLVSGLEGKAGGHRNAAGGHVSLKDKDEFIRRVKNL